METNIFVIQGRGFPLYKMIFIALYKKKYNKIFVSVIQEDV